MNIMKSLKTAAVIGSLAFSTVYLSGCGDVSDAQMKELNDLRASVKSLESQANSLKDERAALEKKVEEQNRKLAECEKQKEETRANLEKLPK